MKARRVHLLVYPALVLIGLATFLVQLSQHPQRAWQAYLVNFLLWSAVAQGGLLFSVVLHITKAKWGRPLQGLAESFAAFFPVSFLLFLILFLGKAYIFPWLHGDVHGKAWWLNIPFLFSRDVAGLLILYGLGFAYLYHALKWKRSQREKHSERMSVFGVLYILAYAAVLSLLAFDLVMSSDPEWVSTLFGAYTFVKAFYIGLGALTILAAVVHLGRGEASPFSPAHFHDLGKLFFAFCLFWADLFYCQFLVIWYGNLPEETSFIIRRTFLMPWKGLAWAVFIVSFIIPFIILLNKRVKTMPLFMIFLCSLVLIGIWFEHFLLLGPSLNPGASSLPVHLSDGLISLGFLGLMAVSIRFLLMSFPELVQGKPVGVKNPVLPPTDVVGPHGASSKEKAILAIHSRSTERARSEERGILAFSRELMDALKRNKWLILLCLISLGLVLAFLYGFYGMPGRDLGPEQPIPFSHHVHAGVKQIQCQFCHPYVSRSHFPGIPPVEKCLYCHKYIIVGHPEIQKEHRYFNTRTPTPWVKANYIPEHVFFNHERHIKKEIVCEQCHGKVETMDRIKGEAFQMGFCIACHREKKADVDCWLACHN